MAQTFVNTGTAAGNREDLSNFLSMINYTNTPFYSLCKKTTATAIVHDWMEDTLQQGTVNARAEGFTVTPSASDNNIRVRRSNNCEIIARTISVSRTQNVVNKAGISGSEYDHQLSNKTLVLPLDINRTLWLQTAVTRVADSGTAGAMSGYFDVDDINTVDAANTIISEELLDTLCQQLTDQGVKPDVIFAAGPARKQINSWAHPNRRYANAEKKLTNDVNEYEGSWGTQSVIYDKDVPTDRVAVTQRDLMRVAQLDPFQHIRLAKVADAESGFVVWEGTFEYGARKAVGSITGLLNA